MRKAVLKRNANETPISLQLVMTRGICFFSHMLLTETGRRTARAFAWITQILNCALVRSIGVDFRFDTRVLWNDPASG